MGDGLSPSIMEVGGVPSFPTPPSSPPPVPSAAGATILMDSSEDLGTQDAVTRSLPVDTSTNRGGNIDGDILEGGEGTSSPESIVDGDIFADAGDGSSDIGDQSLKEGPVVPSGPAVLTEELRVQIVRQVEYYFSDENLPTDKFLLKYVGKEKKGFVPIAIIASFKRMKKLTNDLSLVETALRTSSQLVVSSNGKKVKRLHPLTIAESSDNKSRTVVVENLPEDCSIDYIQIVFGKHGNVKSIALHDPVSKVKPNITISNKVHALVEYESVEEAENAVSSLNDEKNWRSGMRVQILLKRMEKYGLVQKGKKGTHSDKNSDITHLEESTAIEDKIKSVDHKVEAQELPECAKRKPSKGRGRGHIQSNVNALGRGVAPSGSTSEYTTKPVLGPSMPDGTRGFTMGRGKLPT